MHVIHTPCRTCDSDHQHRSRRKLQPLRRHPQRPESAPRRARLRHLFGSQSVMDAVSYIRRRRKLRYQTQRLFRIPALPVLGMKRIGL
jgi:hypothetical protein